jgi:IPT/TIG domain
VIFTMPGEGASAVMEPRYAITNLEGVATSPPLTANSVRGSYNVTASVGGVSGTAVYSLTNTKLLKISPTSGPIGALVTIKGSGLAAATQVELNGTSAPIVTLARKKIVASIPSGAMSGKIVVVLPGGTATSKRTFTVN